MIKSFISRLFHGYEPAVAYAIVEAVVALGLAVAVSYGVDISAEVVAGVLGLVAVLTGKAVRESVYSKQSYNDAVSAEVVIRAAEEG
jgi:hydrogenase/urease accessory protein HupE